MTRQTLDQVPYVDVFVSEKAKFREIDHLAENVYFERFWTIFAKLRFFLHDG